MIEVSTQQLDAALQDIAQRVQNTAPLMRAISVTLLDETMENFESQGRPTWMGLSKDYAKQRGGGQILRKSGILQNSVLPFHSASVAGVGTNVEYAAAHQFGVKTKAHVIKPKQKQSLFFNGRFYTSVNHPGSDIPARPFLPFINGHLQPQAEIAVLDTIEAYLLNF